MEGAAHGGGDGVGGAVADDLAAQRLRRDTGLEATLHCQRMIGSKVRGALFALRPALGALAQYHGAGLDADRAAAGADVAGGAGIQAGIVEAVVQFGEPRIVLVRLAEALHLAGHDDALAGAQCQLRARAGRLAEAALDAQIDDRVTEPHLFEMLEMHGLVVGDQDARIEQIVRVEQRLDLAHDAIGGGAPFAFDERCDGAPGAMLGLERAAIAHRHELAQIFAEDIELLRRARRRQLVAHLEVEIAGEGVTEDHRILVAVLIEELAHVDDEVGQPVDGGRHVLGQHGGARPPRRARRGEEAFAHVPQRMRALLVGGEVEVGRAFLAQNGFGLGLLDRQLLGRRRRHVDQHGRRRVGEKARQRRDDGNVLDGRQGPALDIFGGRDPGGGLNAAIGKARDGAGAGIGIGKGDQPGHLVGVLRNGGIGHLRDKAERAFRPDDQMDQDVDGIVEVGQGVDRIADGVLDPVFLPDQLDQLGVLHHLVMQGMEGLEQAGLGSPEGGNRVRVARVEHRSIGQHQPHALQRMVSVVCHAAAHARRIVVDHAADLAGRLAGRVRAELAVERLQRAVGVGHDDRRPERDAIAVVVDAHLLEAVAKHAQHAIGVGLAAERGAGGTEGHGQMLGPGGIQRRQNLRLGIDDHHQRRHQPVLAGIAGIGIGHQRIGHDPAGQDFGGGLKAGRHTPRGGGAVGPGGRHVVHGKPRRELTC